jgi:glycosyltransferase involved in cell wall biosynthesis
MPELVSIVIPCHNAAPWLAQTLESALGQTWKEKEVILVDDGSTDGSLAVAAGFEPRGVTVVSQANRGASAARNHGLRLARGSFIQYLDADDLLAPDKVALQMEMAGGCGPDRALCCTWSRFISTPSDADFSPQPLCRDAAPVDWVVSKLEGNAMMHPAAWLTPRPLSERAGPWNESLSLDDDGEYFTRIVLASHGVRFCPAAVSFYRSRLPGSLSRSNSDEAWGSALRSLELSSAMLRQVEDSPRVRSACATAFQQFIYSAYPQAAESRMRAARHVAELGGSSLMPPGGPRFRLASRMLGWRLATRLARLFR